MIAVNNEVRIILEWTLGLRTPIGFAAVRMTSERILKVSDMVEGDCDHGHCNPLINVQNIVPDHNATEQ